MAMQKFFILVVLITVLDLGSTRPAQKRHIDRKQLKFVVVNLHDNVTLTCPFNAQSITFYKDHQIIGVNQNTRYLISGNSLTLIKFVMRDNGLYECKVGQTKKKFTWALHINLTTTSKHKPEKKERPENSAVMLDCRYFSNKTLFYSANKGNRLVKISSSGRVSETTQYAGLYKLSDLKISDTGYYYCGYYLIMDLVVRGPPKVFGKTLVKVGDNADLTCKYKGRQTIAWYKDGKKIQNSRDNSVTNTNQWQQSVRLRLTNITSSGVYGCGATFDNNQTVFATIKLQIFEITMFKLVGEINVANSTVFVMCFSNQNGAKYELWKRPRYLPVKPYKKVKMGSRVKELNTPGFYQIEPLRKADEGYYKCRASVNGTTVEKEENNDPIWIS